MRYLITILILLFSCTKQRVEPVIPEQESTYSFEVITKNDASIRYTTDMVKFTELNHTGNWKYEWKQLPSTHKPITFQVGIWQCCFNSVTLSIRQDGKILKTQTFTNSAYSIAY